MIYRLFTLYKMEILKTFILDESKHEVQILHKDDSILFRAMDIGRVLGLGNVRSSIQDFDEDEKVVQFTDSLGGPQLTTFLTREGVYRLVMRSNKPIARPFQKWIAHVIKSIEETGRYVLKEHVEEIAALRKVQTEHVDQVAAMREDLNAVQAEAAVLRTFKAGTYTLLTIRDEARD